jgi:hypothetical protein
MTLLFIICFIIVYIAVWRIYHSIFHVTYFGFGAIVREIMGIGIISMFLAALLAGLIGGIFIH